MFVKVRKVSFGDDKCALFGSLGFMAETESGSYFVTNESEVIFTDKTEEMIDNVLSGWKNDAESGYPPRVRFAGEFYPVDIENIQTLSV